MLAFDKRKQDILAKQDKSSKKSWDKKIKSLCEEINKKDNYYTTSSCAGRIVLIKDEEKKGPELFIYVNHDFIKFNQLKDVLNKVSRIDLIKFKQEPCILHVACKSLEDAEKLLKNAQLAGWKRSGIIATGNRFVCELIGTDKLEFFIIDKGKILVNDLYLDLVIRKSNENLKKSWDKIQKLEKLLK